MNERVNENKKENCKLTMGCCCASFIWLGWAACCCGCWACWIWCCWADCCGCEGCECCSKPTMINDTRSTRYWKKFRFFFFNWTLDSINSPDFNGKSRMEWSLPFCSSVSTTAAATTNDSLTCCSSWWNLWRYHCLMLLRILWRSHLRRSTWGRCSVAGH